MLLTVPSPFTSPVIPVQPPGGTGRQIRGGGHSVGVGVARRIRNSVGVAVAVGVVAVGGGFGPRATATGLVRWIFVPSPSWPSQLRPQHLTSPVVVMTQLCSPPPR